MKYLVTFLAIVLFVGCASDSRTSSQPRVTAPAKSLSSPLAYRTITIVETNPVVYVSGEVRRPGRCAWSPGLMLTNVIELAGGFTDFADRRRLEIRHNGSVERYNYQQVISSVTNSVLVEHGDVVYARRKFLW